MRGDSSSTNRFLLCESLQISTRSVLSAGRDLRFLGLCVMLGLLFAVLCVCVCVWCVCVCVFCWLLGNFWPPAQQTEIKLVFSSVRGQLASLWSLNVSIMDNLRLSAQKYDTRKALYHI